MPRVKKRMLAAEKSVARSRSLLQRVYDARERSDALFKLVRSEWLYERPIPERHRIIFYLGHLEAFDFNLLNQTVLSLKSVHPEFDRLFAFGIDPVGGGLPADVPADWPSLAAVRDYAGSVRSVLDDNLASLIDTSNFSSRNDLPLQTVLNVAIEHRLMHIETLSYMLHQLPLHMKIRPPVSPRVVSQPAVPQTIAIPAGVATLGLPGGAATFGWDNEYAAHAVEVGGFEIDRYKVSNRQYLEFVMADGYIDRAFWRDEDWNWKITQKISHPLFWKNESQGWHWRTMFEDLPLPLDWPVYVSHAEASAYARWAGKSLPTEPEWQRAAYGALDGETRCYPWGNEPPDGEFGRHLGNFDFHSWDPAPVNDFPRGRSAFGVQDLLGNGWEWTSTVFAPFPGFEPFPFYRGYSADFFDGKHFVMKGGSARTAACLLRPTFRNWFQAHYQYVYAGFRCVSR